MKVIIPGGTGHIGRILARSFHAKSWDTVILSRRPTQLQQGRNVLWDGKSVGGWKSEIDGADLVINLAGKSVNCRYHAANLDEMMSSRIDSTLAIGQAISESKSPPPVWLQMSTATIYAHRYDAPNDESTGIIGGNEPDAPALWAKSIEIAKEWERATNIFETQSTRKVILRTAMVMSPEPGGALAPLTNLVRFGLGGKIGDGRQYMSWIHDVDFVRAIWFLYENQNCTGIYNLSSPSPLPQEEFMRVLRKAWGSPIGLPATKWMLEIGTFLLRTESELVLKSRRVIPARLSSHGFSFQFSSWHEAALDLAKRARMSS